MSALSWLETLREWDVAGFHLINGSLRNRFFDLLMPFISDKWNFALPVGVLFFYVLLFRPKRDRIVAIGAIAVILLADETSQLLKELFQRTRPVLFLHDAIRPRSFSFPSSHASNMFALATFLSYNYFRLGLLCFVAAVLVGYSRIYLGSHYPIDVLGGALLGGLTGLLGVAVTEWLMRSWHARPTRPSSDNTEHPACKPEGFQSRGRKAHR